MSENKKTIVCSDVHMSDGKKYSWFTGNYPEYLRKMLKKFANDRSVEELIFLGDLFDLWVYPVNVVPWTISKIIRYNSSITNAIKNCVQNIPNVYYIAGNHDMGLKGEDLNQLNSGGNQIKLVDPSDYNAIYNNMRHLEHGHAVDIFNAPDDSNNKIGNYPLGFFISRLIATAADQSAAWQALKGLLQRFAATYKAKKDAAFAITSTGSYLVEKIITRLETNAKVSDDTPIRFSEPELDEHEYIVGDIKKHYGIMIDEWHAQYPDEFLDRMLVGFSPNGLNWYAKKLRSENPELKVVVMGHTHHALSMGRYDNDGCWCIPGSLGHGDGTPHYVEIVGNTVKLFPWS
jgi:UDP-2,3-diacylglucosamine pyrophosphatase LpxH